MSSSQTSQSLVGEFRYHPLADADEIRILSVEAGTHEDPIRCQLHHIKLSEKPVYEALSYMWGPTVFKTISLNGQNHQVRQNLWQALIHLRLKNSNLIIWIDAVCINQDDKDERNQQVMQMGQIYSRAARVLAWLGLADPSTGEAMTVLKRLEGPSWRRTLSKMKISQIETEAIEILCSRDYWGRLWIVQEIHLAYDVLICCGYFQLSWELFAHGLKEIVRDQTNFPTIDISGDIREKWEDNSSYTLCMDRANPKDMQNRVFRAAHPSLPLGTLCHKYGASRCEDIKDKVFGLHALAADCCKKATVVDYAAPWSSTWQSVVAHYFLIHKVSPPDIVAACQMLHRRASTAQIDYNYWLENIESCSIGGVDSAPIEERLSGMPIQHIIILKSELNISQDTQSLSHEPDDLPRLRCLLSQVRYLRRTMSPQDTDQISSDMQSPINESTSEKLSPDYLCNVHGWTFKEAQIIGTVCDVGVLDNGVPIMIPKGCSVGDRLCVSQWKV
ncbi:heterokaryon incompatibility protein-domain-containing protein [Cadophora sp. MPI-SDFR-AT-0126]|nr:heterokaryon incompatibility protein-domain-containing protein [Leotiomycetes sp. MPI-SDFR-AT-0126]